MQDKLLIYRCKRGSREALTRIYQKYKADLLLLAMALINDKAAAEDVLHDVFLSFVRDLDRFRLTGSLKGYLLTCVANAARNQNRSEYRRSLRQDRPVEPTASEVDGPAESVACNEQLERLSQALAELPFEQREAIMLHLQGAMTFAAIGQARKVSVNTVKSRYRYGLDRLRLLLNGEVVAK